jgi:hypothetical protein
MRRHANYVPTVGAALLVIGFGLIAAHDGYLVEIVAKRS